jgi:hypothetical protein
MIRAIISKIRRRLAARTVPGDPARRDADWPSRAAYDNYEQFGGPK